MAYIPEDRTHVGTAPDLSITDNVIMKQYRLPPIAHGGLLDMVAATRFATQLKDAYEIMAPQGLHAGPSALGRQPAARDPGTRDLRPAGFHRRGSADTRTGRGRDRGRPQVAPGAA